MAITASDISAYRSDVTWIDALLQDGLGWNVLVANAAAPRTTIYYTFDTYSGTERGSVSPFNAAQTSAAYAIMNYVAQVTGIVFQETLDGASADWHFAETDLSSFDSASGTCYGLCTTYAGGDTYAPDAYVYLDSRTWTYYAYTIQNPVPGDYGYEALLHEFGHALGLKHPFEATANNPVTLPPSEDNTSNTVMSYTHSSGAYYSTFRSYDIAALGWLYGGDGLGGSWGAGTGGEYLVGTNGEDAFNPAWSPWSGSNFAVQGMAGVDTVALDVSRRDVNVTHDGVWLVLSGVSGGSKMYITPDVEQIRFNDATLQFSTLLFPNHDFDGDGKSDVLWHGADGSVTVSRVAGAAMAMFQLASDISSSWQAVGFADFNQDGTSDMLWRNINGSVAVVEMKDAAVLSVTAMDGMSGDWQVAGVGDFDRQGMDDILWRSAGGSVAIWRMSGSSLSSSAVIADGIPSSWQIVGIEDFDGDGDSDLLWHNIDGSVAIVQMDSNAVANVNLMVGMPTDWQVAAVGDLNADGQTDVLWRSSDGSVAAWRMDGTTLIASQLLEGISISGQVVGIGDFDGAAGDEILWHNWDGSVFIAHMSGMAVADVALAGTIPVDWQAGW